MVFPDVFFFLLSFFQALVSHLEQRIHMSEEREKEKERERKRKTIGKGKGNERKRNGEIKRKRKGKRKGKRTGKRKGEGKGKVKEDTGKRKGRGKEKKGRVSHGPFLMPKIIVFVIVLLSFVNPVCVPFFLAIIKKGV